MDLMDSSFRSFDKEKIPQRTESCMDLSLVLRGKMSKYHSSHRQGHTDTAHEVCRRAK